LTRDLLCIDANSYVSSSGPANPTKGTLDYFQRSGHQKRCGMLAESGKPL
jgi:hypothetical protein